MERTCNLMVPSRIRKPLSHDGNSTTVKFFILIFVQQKTQLIQELGWEHTAKWKSGFLLQVFLTLFTPLSLEQCIQIHEGKIHEPLVPFLRRCLWQVQWCSSKFTGWSPNPEHLSMRPPLERESLQEELSCNEVTSVGPDPKWLVSVYKGGNSNTHRDTEKDDDVERSRKKTAIYTPKTEAGTRPFPHSPQRPPRFCTWTGSPSKGICAPRENLWAGSQRWRVRLSFSTVCGCSLYAFAEAAVTNYHNSKRWNNSKALSRGPGGWTSKTGSWLSSKAPAWPPSPCILTPQGRPQFMSICILISFS